MVKRKISFIIPTVNRYEELQSCVSSIEEAYRLVAKNSIEIIVVFQGIDGRDKLKFKYPEIVKLYYLENKGLSLARNFGINKSQGEYLVFLDDDTTISRDFIEVLDRNISVTGYNAFCCRDTDPLKSKLYSMRLSENQSKSLNRLEFVYFMGYAHIIKKRIIEKIGFYDERFGLGAKYPAAEESDIFFKLKHIGEEVIYLPDLVVYHPVSNITSKHKRYNYAYATGAMLVNQIFIDRKHLFTYAFIFFEIIIKSLIRTLFTILFPESTKTKNLIFRYRSVLKGTFKGAKDYLRFKIKNARKKDRKHKVHISQVIKVCEKKIITVVDIFFIPFTYLSAVWLGIIRKIGLKRMNFSKKIFKAVGVLPIRDHYYEPLFNSKHLRVSLRDDRVLAGIDFNINEQLAIMSKFRYNRELARFPTDKTDNLEFYYPNESFGPCDAQYLYNMIRLFKPKKIIEIGSGYSTLMIKNAILANKNEVLNYDCMQVCIDPYCLNTYQGVGIQVIQKRVEEVGIDKFRELDNGDLLFIDSSHIIRPQGDVLFEYLEVLPILKSGVIVHIHDIFTPKDYLNEWVIDDIKLWNEQYLVEAFLEFNSEYRIIAALNYLKHRYFPDISKVCPTLISEPKQEPCSLWIIRN